MTTVITTEEKEALLLFRKRVSDILPALNEYKNSDIWLLRWLRARDLNQEKAEEMLRKYLKWRKDESIDTILEWKVPQVIEQEFPFQVTGFDVDGCLVGTTHAGSWDLKKAAGLVKPYKRELVRFATQLLEKLINYLEYVSMEDRIVYQVVGIVDLEGLSITQALSLLSRDVLDIATELITTFESYYPEILKCGWGVNAPRLIDLLYSIVKPLLSARTVSKIKIIGCNPVQWRKELLKTIPADQIPSRFGGSKTTFHNYNSEDGYEIFPWYDTFNESEMLQILIAPGKKHQMEYILSSGHSLCWNFRSDGHDIGFYLEFRRRGDEDKSCETFFECKNVDSHLHLQRGAILIVQPGKYTIVLDNSGSRVRSKTVYYGVRVKPHAWTSYCSTNVMMPNHKIDNNDNWVA